MCAFRWFFIMLASRLAVPRSGNEEVGKRYLKPSSPGKNLCCLNVKQILQINQNMHVTLGCNCTVCPLTSFIRRHALQKCACVHAFMVVVCKLYTLFASALSLFFLSCEAFGFNKYMARTKTVSNFEKLPGLKKEKRKH